MPCGVIPISTFIVLWCLYDDHVCDLASRFEGLLINTSKQSIITVVLFPKAYLKHCGIVRHKSSHSGHLISGVRRTSKATSKAYI